MNEGDYPGHIQTFPSMKMQQSFVYQSQLLLHQYTVNFQICLQLEHKKIYFYFIKDKLHVSGFLLIISSNWCEASRTLINFGGIYSFFFFVKLSNVGSFTFISRNILVKINQSIGILYLPKRHNVCNLWL